MVREPSGILRTADLEEHDRMMRFYFRKPGRHPRLPDIFKENHLKVGAGIFHVLRDEAKILPLLSTINILLIDVTLSVRNITEL